MSDGSYTRVMFASLDAGEEAFARAYSQLTSTVDSLEAQLRTQLSQWDGTAQGAYQTAQAKWKAAEANMAAVIQQLSQVIGTANANYKQTESVNASMWTT